MGIFKRICHWFNLQESIDLMSKTLLDMQRSLEKSEKAGIDFAANIQIYEDMYEDYLEKKAITCALERCTPDMQWAKDVQGRYMYANKAIKDGLLFFSNPINHTDLEIANIRNNLPATQGVSDAGPVCVGSDKIVLDARVPMKFVERFSIEGVDLILDVHKAPMFDGDGVLIGTAGIGRDITHEHQVLTELLEGGICDVCIETEVVDKIKKILEVHNG